MKKIKILLCLLCLTGCTINFDKEEIGWLVNDLPKYEGSGTVKSIVKKGLVKVENLTEEDKENYINKVKKEFPSVVVDSESVYQAVNAAGQMIKVEYDKEKGTLKVSKEGE